MTLLRPSIAAFALILAAGCGGEPARPNILLVTLDTTRADYFGSYGHPGDPTPNFDALAREGARFDLCISAAAVTPVSHASILTGLYPYEHGLRVMYAPSGFRLPDVIQTLPEVLHQNGWRTGAFLSSYPVSEDFGFDAGFDVFQWPRPAKGPARSVDAEGTMRWDSRYQQRSDITAEQAIAWLDGQRERPFFAWVHFWDPHGGSADPPEDLLRKWVPNWNHSWQRGTSNMTADMRKRYYAAQLEMVDRQFGRIVDHLRATGQWDDTIVVAIADHGEGLGEHGWHSHRILYQEQIWLPLIARAPGLPAGREVHDLVRSIDVFPTVLELADVPLPSRVSGRSFANLWRGGHEETSRVAYAEQLNRLDANARMVKQRPNDAFLHVVMDDTWKIIHRPEKPDLDELFNVSEDPDEAHNLIAARPDVAQRLMADMNSRGGPEGVFRTRPFEPRADGSAPNMDALRDLGYVGDDDSEEP